MPPDLFSPALDYDHVDGVGRARERNISPRLGEQLCRAAAIGPVIEFGNLAAGGGIDELRQAPWFDEGSLGPLMTAMAMPSGQWLQNDGRCGLIKGPDIANETLLNSFKIDAHKAALGASFDKTAALFVAAMGELIGNIIDHSQAEKSGMAIFQTRPGAFEFVVADRGIGVLRSFQQSPDYNMLGDEGQALAAMVEAGVSRHGAGRGHGNGFQPIFERLADMQGRLRFRSGDHALTLDGRFGDRIGRQLSQKPRLKGFFAAVLCRSLGLA